MIRMRNRWIAAFIWTGMMFARMTTVCQAEVGPGVIAEEAIDPAVHPERFELPDTAKVLIVVEGTGGTGCRVSAYEKAGDSWQLRIESEGHLGRNGMSNHRLEGDKTTPIGVFRMNTPFGQKPALEGFPKEYLQVNEKYVWLESSNRLKYLPEGFSGGGEAVGTHWYRELYDYVLDMGYNPDAIPKKGSALFLHCYGQQRVDTSGCVAIPTDKMADIMKLYGRCGDGNGYIALAPSGCFEKIYHAYGKNHGLSPDGDFERK